jgi:stage II sporulation protein E
MLFRVGASYALVGGALAFAFWSGYSGGLSGVLSTVPELIVSGTLILPVLKGGKLRRVESASEERRADTFSAVGTMALSYRSKYRENTQRLIASLEALSALNGRDAGERTRPEREDYFQAFISEVKSFCSECEHGSDCERVGVCPALSGAERLVSILFSGGRLEVGDINGEVEFCERRRELSQRINERISQMEYAHARNRRLSRIDGELALISRLMTEAGARDAMDVAMNSESSARAERALSEAGLSNFSVRVFGERRERIFLAVLDPDGKTISSEKVRRSLSEALSAELCDIEYYRDGGVAMLECAVKERFSVSFAHRTRAADGRISGDSAAGIRTDDGVFYGILCDGMGRGSPASDASAYLLSVTKNLLSFGAGQDTLVELLSCLMARRGEANSTLDLFRLDLFTGEGSFIKCGAAPSYVKREQTLYRIASEGLPVGAGSEVRGERVRVEVKPGDVVIMTSDGVSDTQSSLIEFIGKMPSESKSSLADLAEDIVARVGCGEDDRTALVIGISESSKSE